MTTPWRAPREHRSTLDLLDLVVVPAAFALLCLTAAVPWLRGLDVRAAPLVLALAAVGPFVLGAATVQVLRRGALVSYLVSLVGLAILLVAGVSAHPGVLWSSLAHTPDRLLSETLPLAGGRELLVVPVVVIWLTAAVTAETVTRASSALALGVPVVAYLVAYGATSGAPSAATATGGLVLAGLILAALARRTRDDAARAAGASDDDALHRPGEGRRLVVGVAAGAAVAVVAGVGVPGLHLAGRHALALRRHPAVTAPELVDPVDAIGALRDSDPHAPPTVLGTVTTDAPSTGYAPIAVLDDYDGDIWRFARTFRPTGGRIPPGPLGAPGTTVLGSTTTVAQSWRLLPAYPLSLLPVVDRAERVTGLPIDTDPPTGMAVPTGPLALPAVYGVVSAAPTQTLARLPAGAQVDQGRFAGSAADDLALPPGSTDGVTSAVRFAGDLTGRRPEPTVAFLQATVSALQAAERRIDPALAVPAGKGTVSRGGTSLAEVVNAVTVSHKATPEQFATFLVVVARDLGVPARIATGFALRSRAAATTGITNREAWTWAEIPVLGEGWVVVDPTPAATASAAAPPTPASATTPTTLPDRRANAVPNPATGGNRALAPRATLHIARPTRSDPWPARVVIALLVVAAVLLAGPGVAGARRLLRRRARRGPGPSALAVGAWLELLDGLELAGLRTPPGATGREVTTAAGEAWGPEVAAPVAAVARTAEAAVFSVADSPDPAAAAEAWSTQRALTRQLRRGLTGQRRIGALLRVGHQPRRPVADRRRRTRAARTRP